MPLGLVHVQYAAHNEHWDCLQYAVDNKCPGGRIRQEVRGAPHRYNVVFLKSLLRTFPNLQCDQTPLIHQSSSESASCPSYASNVTTSLMSPSMPV